MRTARCMVCGNVRARGAMPAVSTLAVDITVAVEPVAVEPVAVTAPARPAAEFTTVPIVPVAALPPPVAVTAPAPAGPRRTRTVAIVAGAVVVVLIAVIVIVANRRPPMAGTAAPGSGFQPTAAPAPTAATGPALTDTEPTDSAGPTDELTPTDPPSTDPAATAPPTSIGIVNVAAVSDDPDSVAVGTLFDSYFAGINTKDYQQALDNLDPSGPLNQDDPTQVDYFTHGVSTTTDKVIVVHSITPDTTGDGVLDVRVTFNSHQKAGFGPAHSPDQTCTSWDITYVLTQADDGTYLILRPVPSSHRAC